jgi:hypothetical protein
MGWCRMDKPFAPPRPPEYAPSYSELGVIAQHERLIEVRTPDPDAPNNMSGWLRVYLTPDAAASLLAWLPKAIAMQDHGHAELLEEEASRVPAG